MSYLILLPWLNISDKINLGDFELGTISVDTPNEFEVDNDLLRNALEPFHLNRDLSITKFTYVSKNGQLLNNYNEDEINRFSLLHDILVLSGLSNRQFFSPFYYCNTDQFDYYTRKLGDQNNFVTVSGRRRDGNVQNIITGEALLLIRQPHIPTSTVPIKLNQNLINSLIQASGELQDRTWNKIYNSILSFNQSNTDNAKISQAQEIILMRSAFEQLLSEQNLDNDFEEIIDDYTELKCIGQHQELLEREAQQNVQDDWSISKVWMREFTLVRNVLAHGHDISNLNLRWPLREHLLIGSFIYPVILKRELSEHGLYELTNSDLVRLMAFEELCTVHHLVDFGDEKLRQDFEFPWNEILNRYLFRAGWADMINEREMD